MYETTNRGKMERLIGAGILLQAECEKNGSKRWTFNCTEGEAKAALNPTPEKFEEKVEEKPRRSKKKDEEVKG